MTVDNGNDNNGEPSFRLVGAGNRDILTHLANIERMAEVKPTFREYFSSVLPRKKGSKKPSMRDWSGSKVTLLKSLSKDIDQQATALLGRDFLCGVAVFFLPGTDLPLPIYFGSGWETSLSRRPLSQPRMQNRIARVERDLKYRRIAIPEHSEVRKVVSGKKQTATIRSDHFFLWAKDILEFASSPLMLASEKGKHSNLFPTAGYWNLSLYVRFRKIAAEASQAKVGFIVKGGRRLQFSWGVESRYDQQDGLSAIVGSPVFLNHETFALVASFYGSDGLFDRRQDAIEEFLSLHGQVASSIFGPIYHAIQHEGTTHLRVNLERSLISERLLDAVAHTPEWTDTGTEESKDFVWYQWRKEEESRKREIVELKEFFLRDLETRPLHVYDMVLQVQKSMYEHLRLAPLRRPSILNMLKSKGLQRIVEIPRKMSIADVLQRVEMARRALGLPGRDHVLHQFQVFLLGYLIIRTHENEFRRRVMKDVLDMTYDNTKETHRAVAAYLVRFAWFLTSNFHDIGYPVEHMEDSVDELRKEVATLLHLDTSFFHRSSRFGIDPVLYDEPRTYHVIRRLAADLADICGQPRSHGEAWWYLLRNVVFNDRSHAGASVIMLERALFGSKTGMWPDADAARDDDPWVRFISRHILLPIMIHHIYSWKPDVHNCLLTLRGKKRHVPVREPEENLLDPILQNKKAEIRMAIETLFRREKGRWLPRFKIPFSRVPIAGLLTLCDCMHDFGRKAGNDDKDTPRVLDQFVFSTPWKPPWCYMATFTYRGPFKKHFADRVDEMNQLRSVFDLGVLQKICIRLKAKKKNGKTIRLGPGNHFCSHKRTCPCTLI